MAKYQSGMYEYMPSAACLTNDPVRDRLRQIRNLVASSMRILDETGDLSSDALSRSISIMQNISNELISLIGVLEKRMSE